jgi:DNA-binding transcriptional MerR regulator
MPEPPRAENNYRQYPAAAIERLRYIVSARSLGFSLADIREFLSARDEETLPCQRVLDSIGLRIADLDRRIADLLALRDALSHFRDMGASLPPSKKCDESCTDYMASNVQEHGLSPTSIETGTSITFIGDKLK